MVRQIREELERYKERKGTVDREHTMVLQSTKEKCSDSYFEQIRPEIEQRYLKSVNELKAQARARVAYELQKVDRWVSFLIQDIHPEALNELKAIEGMQFTDAEREALIARYSGDHFAIRRLSEMFNKELPETNKIQYTPPEEFLVAMKELEDEVNCIIENYGIVGEGIAAGVADVRLQLAEKTLANFEDRFTNAYFAEDRFDHNTPLTPGEEKVVASIFAGISPNATYQMRFTAEKAAKQGKGGLIARSEYAKYLKDFDLEGVEISALYEKFLAASTFESVAVIREESTEPNVDHLLGMGAENAQEADQAVNNILNESIEEASSRIAKEIIEEVSRM